MSEHCTIIGLLPWTYYILSESVPNHRKLFEILPPHRSSNVRKFHPFVDPCLLFLIGLHFMSLLITYSLAMCINRCGSSFAGVLHCTFDYISHDCIWVEVINIHRSPSKLRLEMSRILLVSQIMWSDRYPYSSLPDQSRNVLVQRGFGRDDWISSGAYKMERICSDFDVEMLLDDSFVYKLFKQRRIRLQARPIMMSLSIAGLSRLRTGVR